MTRRAAIYARVSTPAQQTAPQVERLQAVAAAAGWQVVATYDETASGAPGRGPRTALDAMLRDAARRRFDVVMAFDVSRLGRSIAQLVTVFEALRSLGVDLYLDKQGFDTQTPMGRMMLNLCAIFAEFEREMIVERTQAGLHRARARGARIGRPPAGDGVVEAIRAFRAQGRGIDWNARHLRCGKGLSMKVCREFDREQREEADAG